MDVYGGTRKLSSNKQQNLLVKCQVHKYTHAYVYIIPTHYVETNHHTDIIYLC